MCLAIPGKIVDIREDRNTRMATVDFDGIRKEICLAYLPDVVPGDYTIVHVGFAISKVDEQSALETLAMFKSLGLLQAELGGEPAGEPVGQPAGVPVGQPAGPGLEDRS